MFNRKLLSISIASVLLTSSLSVSANAQKDDEDDSVNSWGKWAQNYATAAGGEINTAALAFGFSRQSETGNVDQNTPVVDGKGPGYRQYVSWGKGNYSANRPNGTARAAIAYTLSDEGSVFSVISESGDSFSSGSLGSTSGVDPRLVPFEDEYFASGNDNIDGGEGSADYQYISLEAGDGDYNRGYWYEDTWVESESPYPLPSQESESEPLFPIDGPEGMWATNEGFFIEGFTSSLDAVNQLAVNVTAGNASAMYYGSFLNHRSKIRIEVDFGASPSWAGDFGVAGYGGFHASGVIQGVDLVGNIDGGEGASGTIEASFFGENAGVIAGIAEANLNGGAFVEVFETNQGRMNIE